MSASVQRSIQRSGVVSRRPRGVQDHGKRSRRPLIKAREDIANGIQRVDRVTFQAPVTNQISRTNSFRQGPTPNTLTA